jgi:hypothetical protein
MMLLSMTTMFSVAADDMERNEEEASDKDDNNQTLGEKILDQWNHRKKKLVTDINIAGWRLSPSSEVRNDCIKNHEGSHRNGVEQVLKQWMLKLF